MRAMALAGLALLACAGPRSAVPEPQSPEQERYLAEVGNFPLEFSVRRSDLGTAVDRAFEWLGTYHSLKSTEADREVFKKGLRSMGGMIVSPMTRSADLGRHSYLVVFEVRGGSVDVLVGHEQKGGSGLKKVVSHRAHVLAYYIKTGQLMPELAGD